MSVKQSVDILSVASRMNRLPPTAYFTRLVARISLGGLFEFYDLFLAGAVGAALIHFKYITTGGMAYFVGSGFLGMFLGTIFFGMISDKIGRRAGFTYSLLIYSLFTFFMALSSTAGLIYLFRLLAGFGVGAQLVVIDTYISEMTPVSRRGFYIAFSQFITFWAVPLVAFLSYVLAPTHFLMQGWRWVVIVGSLGAAVVWWIRLGLPESPRWYEIHGQTKIADTMMSNVEKIVQSEYGKELPEAKEAGALESEGRFKEIWSPPYRGRTIMLMVFNFFQTIGFYGFAAWVPTLLISEGITFLHSLLYTFVIALANPFGPLIGMWTSDKIQRKWLIVFLAIGIGLVGTIFSQVRVPALIMVVGVVLTLLNNWFSPIFHSYQAELYPTRVRATGVGFTYSWSRLSAVFTGFIIVALLKNTGVTGVFVFIAIAMLIVAGTIGFFGPKTNNRALEDISK